MDKKQNPMIYCLQEAHFSSKDTHRQNEGMEIDISRKLKPKERGSYSNIRQNRFLN